MKWKTCHCSQGFTHVALTCFFSCPTFPRMPFNNLKRCESASVNQVFGHLHLDFGGLMIVFPLHLHYGTLRLMLRGGHYYRCHFCDGFLPVGSQPYSWSFLMSFFFLFFFFANSTLAASNKCHTT